MNRARVIAYYLPQFHPIPENDENWGKGFTEWTNVANAKPLWRGHHQPRIPKDLGFYDLRLQETRIAQAEMAREAGVEGFMYWHYDYGVKMYLDNGNFGYDMVYDEDDYCIYSYFVENEIPTWVKNELEKKLQSQQN